ncbi:MAG: OprO/OprP family phosphate-selective porin [Parvibaculaceae bacterium]
MITLKKSILTLATIASLTIGATSASFASDNVNARIEALESALKELRNEVKARDDKIAAMEVKTAEIDKMPVFSDKKLEVKSRDGQFAMAIGGRLQADAYAMRGSSLNKMGNGMEIRRARFNVSGTMFGSWNYKLEAEYAGTAFSITDAYIEHEIGKGFAVKAGHFKEYYGIENLTSDANNTFMEAGLSSIYSPTQNMGVGATYTDGKLFGVQGGFFTPGIANGGKAGTSDWATTGRVYVAPTLGSGVVHVGLNGSYRGYEASGATGAKFEQSPESHAAPKVLSTGTISSPSSETRFGPEVAAIFGPVTVQGEYTWSEIDRGLGLPSISTEGGYAEASWFVTGESRNYSVKTGTFGKTKASNAIQLAVRLSQLDLSDKNLTDPRRGIENNVTLGANYYFNPNVRLMVNYIHADLDYVASPDETDQIIQSRLQLDW